MSNITKVIIIVLPALLFFGCQTKRPTQKNIYIQLDHIEISPDTAASNLANILKASIFSREDHVVDADTSKTYEITRDDVKIIISQVDDVNCPASGLHHLTYKQLIYRVDILLSNKNADIKNIIQANKEIIKYIESINGSVLAEKPSCPE